MTQIKQSRKFDVGLADVQDNRGQTQNFLLSVTLLLSCWKEDILLILIEGLFFQLLILIY